jgi:hypothetical protein
MCRSLNPRTAWKIRSTRASRACSGAADIRETYYQFWVNTIKLGVVAIAVAALAAIPSAASAPPAAGVLVPGESLGGLRLGATPAQVTRAWGRGYGVCRNCATRTWYFNLSPFQPQGAVVEFRRRRVSALTTLWSPGAWHDRRNLRIGESAARITELYGPLETHGCDGYTALPLRSRHALTVYYVLDGKLWGFGLLAPDVPICR